MPSRNPGGEPSPDNREQHEYWNGPAAERWVRHQVKLDRGLGPFGAAALDRLAPRPGEHILDIGCGSGATLLDLASRVGSTGAVLGVDLSRPLLELAATRTRAASSATAEGAAAHVALLEADAARHAFTPSFHALFSRFGVMFFADPVGAFENLRRALLPGGRVVFACWQRLAENPWCAVPLEAASRALGALPPPPDPYAPGPFAFADPEHVTRTLMAAGFAQVELEPFRAPVLMSDDGLAGGLDFVLRVGPVSRLYADLNDTGREAVRRELAPVLAPLMAGETLALDGSVWLVSARG